MFCEESLGKIHATGVELFRKGSVLEFYRLKALITLEQVNTSVVEKKKNLTEQNFDGEANWSGVANFHCMQMTSSRQYHHQQRKKLNPSTMNGRRLLQAQAS